MAALVCSGLVLFCLLFSFTEAREHLVGGKSDSWKVPSSQSESLNKWAESNRFLVGDSLVWKFDAQKDSVLQVSESDYSACNVSNPMTELKNGNTKVELDRAGAFYFISGAKGHCEQGEKMVVLVMSSSKKSRFFNGGSPSPSPMVFGGVAAPAPSPTSGSCSLRSTGFWSSFLTLVIAFFYF